MRIVKRCASFMRKSGCCGICIYRAYCGCSELVVGIANMGKLPELDDFDRGQTVGARHMIHSISEIIRQLELSMSTVSKVYQEYMDKTRDRAKCKGQLAMPVLVERQLKRIVHSQKTQTLPPSCMTVSIMQSVNGLCKARFSLWVSGTVHLRE
ncbi:uncharacterized protein TNCV_1740741 [Trichonephila clavipes]|uniref:Uncharacterized protein n=1 Tax=Trichonephila clavipes TaxID=2585209 RepID=A0A8X6RH48_TRICX|nr:uncharacterized protein TNCV_1740741 [Trichonephila clavipes]